MSTPKKTSPANPGPRAAAAVDHVPSSVKKMDPWKRRVLIGLAIFCLVIFSVTGPMATVFGRWFSTGPGAVARLVLPGGRAEISEADYLSAQSYYAWYTNFFGGSRDPDTKEILAFAAKRKLADAYEVGVPDAELQQYLSFLVQISRADYRTLYQRYGFNSALEFEAMMRELMRISKVDDLLASVTAPTDAEALDKWRKDFSELRYEFIRFHPDQFAAAAADLQPEEAELQQFFDSGLSTTQRSTLEREDAIAFAAVVVSAEALETAAVKAWAPAEEPSAEALQGFYDFHKYYLYARPDDDPKFETETVFSVEELGDKLARDFKLSRAALQLLNEVEGQTDLPAFAAAKGVEYLSYEEPVGARDLRDLPRVGAPNLYVELQAAEAGKWLGKAIVTKDGVGMIVRVIEKRPRAMPPLVEVRDSVVDFWREKKREDLAKEAAETFVANLPKPADHVAGDPVTLSAEEFAKLAGEAGREPEVQDWVARQVRTVTDPMSWSGEERVLPWLRTTIGQQLDDYRDGEVVGPFANALEKVHVVARVAERRPADPATMWPAELSYARRVAKGEAAQRFQSEMLGFAGLGPALQIEDLISTRAAEEQN